MACSRSVILLSVLDADTTELPLGITSGIRLEQALISSLARLWHTTLLKKPPVHGLRAFSQYLPAVILFVI